MINTHHIKVFVDYELEQELARITLKVGDHELIGKSATLSIHTIFDISAKWVDGAVPECSLDIGRLEAEQHFTLPMADLALMPYVGANVSIRHDWKLHRPDGETLGGTVWKDNIRLPGKPKQLGSPGALVEPVDHFSFTRNFSAIDSEERTLVVLMSVFTLIVALVLTGLGIHDQTVSNKNVIVFQHGKATHSRKGAFLREPLGKAGAIISMLLVAYLALLRKLLRTYISFRVKAWPERFGPGEKIRVADLVYGRPLFTVRNLTLRIVAANYERVSYYDWSQRENVDIRTPIRAVVLYEKTIPLLKSRQEIGEWLGDDEFSLAPLYEKLLPPKYSGDTGVFVHWEVQLLHEDFVDYEVVGPADDFVFTDFYRDEYLAQESVGR